MADTDTLTLIVLGLVAVPSLTGAIEHVVGGYQGWSVSVNYTSWAQDRQFFVGDTLVFNYRKGDHDVVEVDRDGFAECAEPANARVLGTGKDVVTLSSPGEKWYICGLPSHCTVGDQKVAVAVLPLTPSPEFSTEPEMLPPPPTSVGSREGGGGSLVVVVGVMMAVVALVMV